MEPHGPRAPAPTERRMRWLGRLPLLLRCATLALAVWPLAAAPLWACSTHSSVWDWDRCWISLPRWLLLAAAGSGWWVPCFHRLFPFSLAPPRSAAPLARPPLRRRLARLSLPCA